MTGALRPLSEPVANRTTTRAVASAPCLRSRFIGPPSRLQDRPDSSNRVQAAIMKRSSRRGRSASLHGDVIVQRASAVVGRAAEDEAPAAALELLLAAQEG